MIGTLKHFYVDSTLPGTCLIQPLRKYRLLFANKRDALGKLAHVITGIIAYPIFGLLAAMGMLIKGAYCSWEKKERDENQKHIERALGRHFPHRSFQVQSEENGEFTIQQQ